MQGPLAVGKSKELKSSDGSEHAPMPVQSVDAVGRKLKESYDQMLREPIPEKLMQLLEQLERSQSAEGVSQPSSNRPEKDIEADSPPNKDEE